MTQLFVWSIKVKFVCRITIISLHLGAGIHNWNKITVPSSSHMAFDKTGIDN